MAETAVGADLGEPVDDGGESRCQKGQAGDVEVSALLRRGPFQAAPGLDEADQREGHVDPEDEPPRELVDDEAAEDRPEDRADKHGQADGGHDLAERPPAGTFGPSGS